MKKKGWGSMGGVAARVVVVAVAVLLLTAGACEDRGTRDAPIDTSLQDNTSPYIINMPDGFMNLSLKCLEDTLVVVHTRTAPPVLIDDSNLCREGGPIPQADLSGGRTN
jgi:hypothetical protein